MTDKPTITIYSMFDFTSGIDAAYDTAGKGLSESFAITGHVWNTDDYRFLHKKCRVNFVKGLNKKLDKFAKEEGFEGKVCGVIRILKDVEPDKFDVEGTEYEEPPLELTIYLLENEFYAIERVCKHSIDQGRKLMGSFHIFSKEFCEKNLLFLNIKQFDVSITKEYIVTSFSLGCSKEIIIPKHKRTIRSPESKIDSPRKSIIISVTNTKFDILMPYGHLDQLRCWGNISNRKDSEIDGIECSIELKEYEIDFGTGEYPERDYAGTFFYYNGENPYIDIELKFKKSDVGDLLRYLIDASSNSSILITCSVNLDEEALSAENEIRADITHYTISVSKYFDKVEKKAKLFSGF